MIMINLTLKINIGVVESLRNNSKAWRTRMAALSVIQKIENILPNTEAESGY